LNVTRLWTRNVNFEKARSTAKNVASVSPKTAMKKSRLKMSAGVVKSLSSGSLNRRWRSPTAPRIARLMPATPLATMAYLSSVPITPASRAGATAARKP
jgi:hypothetical protein